ncbi:MAG TPA: metallophosphoesterase family protein [Streptosporangiaceae bacterium]|nr:metallophosphoesterase family protein [Streptosporangiaceae bacterium]
MLTGLVRQPEVAGAPAPEQVHLQFGADASGQVTVSWAAPAAVARPRLRFGQADGQAGTYVDADERRYTDALTGETVWTYHAVAGSLEPDTPYGYEVVHDGAAPVTGTFRTAPLGRSRPFRFTSFGDHAIPAAVGDGSGPHSPNAGYVVTAVDRLGPLFHLVNGDLCYANASDQPVATWTSYLSAISRSATHRPWMPVPGNHENESGNGPQGYLPFQTRFSLPANGTPAFRGNWYAFTAGSVRFVALNNDDVCLQDGGFSGLRRDNVPGYRAGGVDPYISGYSGGRQRLWLERELAAASQDDDIDWIVVFMHQVAMSSAHFNGADFGIRQHWLPLFDAYGVDLVLSGHEHHFERSHPVRGVLPGSALLTPAPVAANRGLSGVDAAGVVDTRFGTVHLTIGGGGHPYRVPARPLHGPDEGVVVAGAGPGSPLVQRKSDLQTEPNVWSAYRDTDNAFGFASFDVVPAERDGTTSITVTYWAAADGSPDYREQDRVVLRKPVRVAQRPGSQLAVTRQAR